MQAHSQDFEKGGGGGGGLHIWMEVVSVSSRTAPTGGGGVSKHGSSESYFTILKDLEQWKDCTHRQTLLRVHIYSSVFPLAHFRPQASSRSPPQRPGNKG